MPNTNRQPQMRILLVDDDEDVRTSIYSFLAARDHDVIQSHNGKDAISRIERERFDIVITDIKMPGADGYEILQNIKQHAPETEVIMMTGYGDVDMAVRAMRDGAFDFFTKPVKMQEISASIERTARFHTLRKERDQAQAQLKRISTLAHQQYGLNALIGHSSTFQDVKVSIEQICETDNTSVLLTGETGTGKEGIARAIHYESSRANGPFVAVDCTAIPENLFESVFYGHEKGAFTDAHETRQGYFEQAHGGTLFLDEIGDMPSEMQVRLLRTLEERKIRRIGSNKEIDVDVRVISATNQDLSDAIAQGQFRQELFHRINTFLIHSPPLRERLGDIQILTQHFLNHYAREMRKTIQGFTETAQEMLNTYTFPGNVRELKNTIERAVILCKTDHIFPSDLQFTSTIQIAPKEDTPATSPPTPHTLAQALQSLPNENLTLATVELDIIQEALRRCQGNRGDAADLLGLSRFALRRRMALYNVE
ncbi:MAG: DNA-binding NtrC family response regulator [Candidatus Latescibacterota bacterium]|jgi:DNA-binding NtrC family response regulator